MKTTKKFLVYYNEDRELIGMREHHFDWEEGDVITTDGVRTVIFGIFDRTKKKWVRVLDDGFVKTGDLFEDMMNALVHSHMELVDVHKKVWKDFDAQLDFIDSVFARMD